MPPQDALQLFHPLIRDWFRASVGQPTPVQQAAWPVIARGEHALVCAPTGSGKTLTAFLWALDRLTRGEWESAASEEPGVRVLYVSPLKALGTDIRNNLTAPLEMLRQSFRAASEPFPAISVQTRSGDTPQNERQRMLRRPPEILITTPESLNLLISARRGREILRGVQTVILDEIHAVVGGKRGVHLMTAVERLTLLSGPFQRIALSATVRPLERVARFVGGYDVREGHGEPVYEPRPVRIVEAPRTKQYEISVHFPIAGPDLDLQRPGSAAPGKTKSRSEASGEDPEQVASEEPSVWDYIVAELIEKIRAADSTLVFANNRRLSEQLARMLNDIESGVAYAHHGSLSRELRRVVEVRLKRGELSSVVATSSLELGIDVGSLDQVLLVETPRSIASAIQRVGRAGHGVGEVSRGRIYPSHGRDLLEAAVMGRAIREGAIEPVRPVEGALDVLAQVILSMAALDEWTADELYAFLKTGDSYHALPREHYDLVLDMLRGRFEGTRIRELRPRISITGSEAMLRARDGALRLLYSSGGTIPDRGYFDLRTSDTRAKIGTLDEEFVWERSIGDAFMFGVGAWRITRITHNDVEVTPAAADADLLPFWRAESLNRSFFFSERIGAFLERADAAGSAGKLDDRFARELEDEYDLDPPAASALTDWLARQHAATGVLPHRRRVVAEHFRDPQATSGSMQIILHTHWGGRVNRPLALALLAGYEAHFGQTAEYFADDDCVNLLLPEDVSFSRLLEAVPPERIESLLREKLEATGFFGARFRENAGRALLLPRGGFKQRMPLWLNRRRSKKLLEDVQAFPDFPMVVETWRTCLADEFDLEHLRELYGALVSGDIELREVRTEAPSPFAAGVIWRQVNQLMYADDRPNSARGPSLSEELYHDMVHGRRLRPRIPVAVLEEFAARLQRRSPGYAPTSGAELYDWLGERICLPLAEWRELEAAVARDAQAPALDLLREAKLFDRVFLYPSGGEGIVLSLERLPDLLFARGDDASTLELRNLAGEPLTAMTRQAVSDFLAGDPSSSLSADDRSTALIAEWLQFYGPVSPAAGAEVFAGNARSWKGQVEELLERGVLIEDSFREGDERVEICDAENLEILLRMARRRAAPAIQTRPARDLPFFLASWMGLVRRGTGMNGLQEALERLFGFVAPAASVENDLLPARLDPYRPGDLDELLLETDLVWFGSGREKIAFAFEEELSLFRETDPESAEPALLPDPGRRYDFFELQSATGLGRADLGERIWREVWSGRLSNSAFAVVRRGLATKFKMEDPTATTGRGRWRQTRPALARGQWFALPAPDAQSDALDREENQKARARQLLARYGVLFRELAGLESSLLRWSELFRALRIMELSGEILSGHFFEGVAGPQFLTPAALRLFRQLPGPSCYWMSATDPASPCGLGIAELKAGLPRRSPGNHLVYHGAELILVSENRGRRLNFRVDPDDERAGQALVIFREFLERPEGAWRKVEVETVNDQPAADSPFALLLRENGFRKEMKKLIRSRSY